MGQSLGKSASHISLCYKRGLANPLVHIKLIKVEDKTHVAARIQAESCTGYEAIPTNLHRGYSRENTTCVLLCKQHLLSAAAAAAAAATKPSTQVQSNEPNRMFQTRGSNVRPKCQVLSAMVHAPSVHLTLLDDALGNVGLLGANLVHCSWTPLMQLHITDVAVQVTKRQAEGLDVPPQVSTDLCLGARVACRYFDSTTAEWEAFMTRWAFEAKFVESTEPKSRHASVESSDALALYCNARVSHTAVSHNISQH
jgi:hypothetical protein